MSTNGTTLRDRALEAVERYRAEHPGATAATAIGAVAGELGSTPASVQDAYYAAKRLRDGRPIRASSSPRPPRRRRPKAGTVTDQTERTIAILRRAAEVIEGLPGLNVLEALYAVHGELDVPDGERGEAYFALLGYLPASVELLGPWSDAETPERVAGKLRACARMLERGGPTIVPADPHMPPDLATVRLAREPLARRSGL